MERAVEKLGSEVFDLLIIGGGVYGAACAFEASERGYSVALIERVDFASGTSANSLKTLHGGLRYLQQLNLSRMRSSIRARREWARLAPDHVRPLPFVVATHGLGLRSRPALAAALLANEIVSLDRNAGLRDSCRLPASRLVDRSEYAKMLDGLVNAPCTGAALWYDALALDTERLVLELLSRAADNAAQIANYVEARELLVNKGVVEGVVAVDHTTGNEVRIKARRVIVAGGADSAAWLQPLPGLEAIRHRRWCEGLNLIVNRTLPTVNALALTGTLPAVASGLNGGRRELFFVPWHGRTLIGTHYEVIEAAADSPLRRREIVLEFIQVVRAAAPAWQVTERDIAFVHWGKLALHERWRPGQPLLLEANASIINAGDRQQIAGLWFVSGPKFTTALEIAKELISKVTSDLTPVHRLGPRTRDNRDLLAKLDGNADLETKAQLAAQHMQARTLLDSVLRRTGTGSMGHPGRFALEACARGMGRVLAWSQDKAAAEIAAVDDYYRSRHFWN